jgi:hypothetical protein
MKLLLVNGCSHTAGAEIEYKNQPTCYEKAWPKFVADRLGCEHLNIAKAGSSNQRIIRTTQSWIIKNVLIKKKYKPEDVAIMIMWSGFDRKEVYFHDTNILDDVNPLCKPEYIRTQMSKEIVRLGQSIVDFHDSLFSSFEFLTMMINFTEFLENNKIKYYYINGMTAPLKKEWLDNTHTLYYDYMALYDYVCEKIPDNRYIGFKEEMDTFWEHMSKISQIPMPSHVEFAHWGEDGQKYWADIVFKKFFNKKLI